MKTIEINVTATEDGKLVMSTPTDLEPGEYRAVLVVEEQPVAPHKNGKTNGKVSQPLDKSDEQEMAEILEAVAESEARIAAGWTPTEKD